MNDLKYMTEYIATHDNRQHNQNDAAKNKLTQFKKKRVLLDTISKT